MVSSASLTNYDMKLGNSGVGAGLGGSGGLGSGGGVKQASSVIVSNSSMSFPYPPISLASATLPTNRGSFNSNKSSSVDLMTYFEFIIYIYSVIILK